jgi:hypothetical protein
VPHTDACFLGIVVEETLLLFVYTKHHFFM